MGGFLLSVLSVASGCHGDDADSAPLPAVTTYSMRLRAEIAQYGQTRADAATYEWSDGALLYLQFYSDEVRMTGTAYYRASEDRWDVSVEGVLPETSDGACEVYYFPDAPPAASQSVALGATSRIYSDAEASYFMATDEDDTILTVSAFLTPLSGRLALVGEAGRAYRVRGLSARMTYSLRTDAFSSSAYSLSGTVPTSGVSDYFYLHFTDAALRQLIVDGDGKTAYLRTFGEQVLASGRSGRITLPSAASLNDWQLVNSDNLQPIVPPSLSAVSVSLIRSKAATFAASVTDLGNGTFIDAGFEYGTSAAMESAARISCGTAAVSLSFRPMDLLPERVYFVRAYACNESGTAYSDYATFTTLSEEEDHESQIGFDGFGDDADWDGGSNASDGDISADGYGDDMDWDAASSNSGGSLSADGYDDDENWDTEANRSDGAISAAGFGNDENWDDGGSNTGGTITADAFGDDENWDS